MKAILRSGRLTIAVFALAALLFVSGAIGVLGGNAGGESPSRTETVPALVPVGASRGDLNVTIETLQQRLRALPKDSAAWASLGLAYVEQAKATVNPEYYPKAEGALKKSRAIDTSDNFLAAAGYSALAAARHDFAGARRWAQRGLQINPSNPTLYGALADAETQLGNYDASMIAIQRMLDLSPDADSFARASYSWELRGGLTQARTLMERALESSSSTNQKAFARYYLGELALTAGDPAGARAHYEAGLQAAPNYAALFEGRAKASQAAGDFEAAARDFAEAIARVPQPMYLVEYGELLEGMGRPAEAKVQFKLFEAEQKLFAVNGVAADVEPTLFYADHGQPERALESGRIGLRARPFVEMQDAYAWALYRNGQFAEALTWSAKARSLGTKNAVFEFHAGAIETALGHTEAGRRHFTTALAINPHFNLVHADTARAALAGAR